MAVVTEWTRGLSGEGGDYWFTRIDAPNATVVYTSEFPVPLGGLPWVQVTIYSADGNNFAQDCSLEAVGIYVESNESDVHSTKDVEIAELLAAGTRGADPVAGQFQVEKYPAAGYKFSVTAAADASADDAVVGVFVPRAKE